MELKIYNQSGALKLTVSTSSSSTWNSELMREDAVSASFTHPFYVPLDVNDYVMLEGVKFSIKKEYKPKQKNRQTYSYSVKFYGPEHDAEQVMYLNLTDGQYDVQFSLDGSPREHLKKWVDNMNRIYGREVWSMGDVVVAPNQTIEYNNLNCWDALASMAEAFETEWWADGFTMNLSRCQRGERVSLGYMQGLTSLTQSENTDDVKFFTRLIPLGSTKNIDRSRYGYSRLQLPDKSTYVDRNTQYGLYEYVEEAAFAEIFPHYTGTVSEVRTEEKTGEDGKKFTVYYFKDNGMTFDPCENEIGGLVKQLSFQTGDLGGRDFEANYNSQTKEWEIINTYPDEEIQIPGGNLIPRIGDTYIPWNFRMPVEYETQAELDYKAAVDDYLKKFSEDISKYGGDTDYIYIDKNNVPLMLGQNVRLMSDEYFGAVGYRDSRMTKVVRKLDNLSIATIECTNQVGKGWKTQVDSSISQLKYVVGQKEETVLDILKSWDGREITDYRVLSGLRTLKEIKQRALSRLEKDEAAGHIEFKKGTTVNNGLVIRSLLTARELRSKFSEELLEEGDSAMMSVALLEEGDGAALSTSLLEEAAAGGGGGASTVGELDNASEDWDTVPDGIYSWQKVAGVYHPIKGGGGSSSKMSLSFVSSATPVAVYGQNFTIQYSFSSTMDGEPTGPGTVTYTLNNKVVGSANIEQGNNSFSVGRHLYLGDNTLVVQVTDSYGNSRKLTYAINAVSIAISSTFDDTRVYSGAISFAYIPVGAVEKTIRFLVDGKEIGTVVTAVSNRQQTYSIPAQGHGAHSLEVYAVATIGDTKVESEHLYYEFISTVAGNNTPIIASSFRATEVEQFSTLLIPYIVYNPAALTSSVTLSANGAVVSNQVADRTMQTWSYRVDTAGALTLRIASGSVSRSFALTVNASEIDVQPETADLALFLTSVNRSNNEAADARKVWNYKDIYALLTAFNWATNGWIKTIEGFIALRVNGDARVTIPYNSFANDFRATGKTLEFEFETRDVTDYDAIVLSCMSGGIGLEVTAQKAVFRSQQTTVETQFKEDERVRVSFVVEKRAENRLIYVYVNGEMCGVVQYPEQDNFTQSNPVGISIGNDKCTADIFNIRVYDNNLNRYQLLDNYIADMDNVDKKLELFSKNNIYNDYGDVSYERIADKLPVLTIVGRLPAYKGDKVSCKMIYIDRLNPARSWGCEVVQNDVQGTSSQYYPRKNYKFKFKALLSMENGSSAEKFPIREGDIPVNCFCTKADFAEASGCHNTGMARLVDFILRGLGQLTPPQKSDARVRTTIDGYPIVIFHRETEDSEPTFLGKYNFNNDKSTQETFGFTDGCECWEIRNNTSDRVLFKSSDYSTDDWLNDFEARYPEDSTDYTKLKRLTDWLVSVKGNPAKFKAEASQYLVIDFMLSYYVLTEFFAMVDQRAKNMFLTTFDGTHWLVIFYDNDTCLGINNEGVNAFDFTVEYHDKIGTQDVWNGEQSTLWNNIEQAYKEEIAAMYADMRKNGLLTYDKCDYYLNREQCDKWSEAIYNEDGWFKYVQPLLEDGNGSYLYAAQGSRKMHRVWWLHNRFKYMDSKYIAGDYMNDFATMRLYTPTSWAGVAPSANITLTAYAGQYVNVKYGSYIVGAHAKKNVPITIQAPDIRFNDTETIIYGASQISSLGDLSGLYAGTVDVSKMVKLTELIVGSGVAGYKNTNLTVLSVGANGMLRKLDIRNCPNLTQAIDLYRCPNIREVWAEGTGTTAVVLPEGGDLTLLHLPETITNLTIRNQRHLTDEGLVLVGVERLNTIRWEKNAMDVLPIIERCLALGSLKLERIRITGVDWEMQTLELVNRLSELAGLDEDGNIITVAVVTGRLHVTTANEGWLDNIRKRLPELEVTYDTYIEVPTHTIFVYGNDNTTVGLAGAKVKVNGVEYTADAEGKVSVKTQEKLNIEANTDGYRTATASYSGSPTARTYKLYLDKIVAFKLTIKDQYGATMENIKVTYDGVFKRTDKDGVVTFETSVGQYAYVAEYKGQKQTGDVSIAQSNVEKSIVFSRSSEEFRPVKNGNIQILVSKKDVVLRITGITADYVIDWGDGATTVASNANIQYYDHSYETVGLHPIEIRNCQNVTMCEVNTYDALVAFWSIGDSKISGLNFYNISSLEHIGNDIFTNETNGDFSRRFTTCNNLVSIPAGLFDYCVNANNFISCFSNCYKLTSIPAGLFDNCPNVTDFRSCFSGCNKLTSIPAGLFDNCPNVMSFSSCFGNCKSLSSIPAGLFDNCPNVTNFESCFYYCGGLSSIPIGLFDNCPNVTNFSSCFSNCSSLSNIPAGLFDNCPNVTDFRSCFSGCNKLTSIPAGLFDNCPNVMSFSSCFGNCKSLSSIPAGLFDNCPNVTNFESCFFYCGGLSSIPTGLFDNCPNVTDFRNCFYACEKLLSFTSNLTKVDSSMFFSCYALILLQLSNNTVVPMTNTDALPKNSDLKIKVPAHLVDTYKVATNWVTYADKISAI